MFLTLTCDSYGEVGPDGTPAAPAATITSGLRDDQLPVSHEASGNYLDPRTGEVLPTWDQALDNIETTNRCTLGFRLERAKGIEPS
jgi:hypothetical protein